MVHPELPSQQWSLPPAQIVVLHMMGRSPGHLARPPRATHAAELMVMSCSVPSKHCIILATPVEAMLPSASIHGHSLVGYAGGCGGEGGGGDGGGNGGGVGG